MYSTCVCCGRVLPAESESRSGHTCAQCDAERLAPTSLHAAAQRPPKDPVPSKPQDDVQIRLKALAEVLLTHSGKPRA